MPSFCPRCGNRYLRDPRFCSACMDGEADPERAREILAAAEAGLDEALRMLSLISDARSADVVLGAAEHPRPEIRGAGLVAVGALHDRRGERLAIQAMGNPDDLVRAAAIECLAELGGPAAADALAAQMSDPRDRVVAATALAWLHDPRAVEPLLDAIELPHQNRNIMRSPGSALAWLADPRTVPPLVSVLEVATERWIASRPQPGSPPRPDWDAHAVATDVASALIRIGGPEAEAALSRATARFDGSLRPFLPTPPEFRPFAFRAPPDTRRTVPRWSLELRPAPLPVREPITKFGGQPVWLEAPTWPIAADDGPMIFMAQFAVPGVDGLAYLFIDPSEDVDYSDPSFGGCLLMQPGPPPPRHLVAAVGPTYASEVHEEAFDRFVPRLTGRLTESLPLLEEGRDYPDWEALREDPPAERDDDRDWNKVGGTPLYLQGGPPPGEWQFLFQFTAHLAGREMADGAQCYGLIGPDRRGLFLIEGH
jgi:hypothetical protein